jgi:hypothetical protein
MPREKSARPRPIDPPKVRRLTADRIGVTCGGGHRVIRKVHSNDENRNNDQK